MPDDGFAAFYAGPYRRLLGQLFAVTGDLAEAWVRRVALNLAAMAERSLRRRARAPTKAITSSPCMDGVEAVVHGEAPLKPVLVPKPWATSSDVSVFLPDGTTAAEREAIRSRLAAIDGVAKVTYETPEEAYRRLPEKLRRDGRDPAKVTPLFTPASVPAAFHVLLDRPARAGEVHRALCGSRTTGACAGGLVVLEHPRRSG